MGHWIEEAENKLDSRGGKRKEVKDKIALKKSAIKKNKDENEQAYKLLLEDFTNLIDRINKLPRKERIPFGQILYKQKNNKIDNLLFKIQSSRRILIKEYSGFLSPFKSNHYKNSRSCFLSISREMGKIMVEYKEVKSKRVRLDDEKRGFFSFIKVLMNSDKNPTHETKAQNTLFFIKDFDQDLILQHLDWLAFKTDGKGFFKQRNF
ncbi:MAG: hypothetical protein B7C24_05950 [Bacteroidetes bacterium 4572_77]|nr:MAG: hypothetical protein B7C24_05950 [Bacteroidetes bacterium 4572_77]